VGRKKKNDGQDQDGLNELLRKKVNTEGWRRRAINGWDQEILPWARLTKENSGNLRQCCWVKGREGDISNIIAIVLKQGLRNGAFAYYGGGLNLVGVGRREAEAKGSQGRGLFTCFRIVHEKNAVREWERDEKEFTLTVKDNEGWRGVLLSADGFGSKR